MGNFNSGRNPDTTKKDLCFKAFSQGKPLKVIAKEFNISVRQLSRWQKAENWQFKRLDQQNDQNVDLEHIRQKIGLKALESLDDRDIKPRRWKEVTDSLRYLENQPSSAQTQKCHHDQELENMSDEELDRRIEELQNLLARGEKEPPQGMAEAEPEDLNETESESGVV